MCYPCIPKKAHVNNRSLPSTATLERWDCINVYALDERRVVKRCEGDNDTEIRAEWEVSDLLGRHHDIAEFLGALDDGSIVLERGQVLRDRLSEQTSACTRAANFRTWRICPWDP
ncbi:uncharacterized protein PV06_08287 [Exophiala oligosperma]|uniref:Uncharacterized protein n=1 Tax=Exophiala oligosperma TaxID=215243 RepID=A0A0D2D9A2_9EURO|nr:uncharacterized protein PV06_08287 [Exophiala oligosperma]KIW39698.1 hypothetical protein PV06_08287 [Exophiala oligosperma]